MFFGILTLIAAIAISSVAIYYSVAGLAAIFAAAVIPIIIMGTTLEVSKLITVVWLHRYWHKATWWLKTYLVTAVVVLMFITSLGIFGFLSKAHVEQTSQSVANQSRIERIDQEIARQEARIARADTAIQNVQEQGTGSDSNIQRQIDREQERIDRLYERAGPEIENYRNEIRQAESRYTDQIDEIEQNLARTETLSRDGRIRELQSLIGVEVDGIFGPNTAQAVEDFKQRLQEQRRELINELDQIENSSRVQQARRQIDRIRSNLEEQEAESRELISRLRSQLGTSTGEDIDTVIEQESETISLASQEIDALTEEKFALQAEFRALEAEVGPIKYIAEFVYGSADRQLLEEAVRWVIVIIIFVFDPLAVLLLIASQYTFRWHGKDVFEFSDNTVPAATATTQNFESTASEEYPQENPISLEEAARPYAETDPHIFYNNDDLATKPELENPVDFQSEKKDTELQEQSAVNRQAILQEQDNSEYWDDAKRKWKQDHPDKTIKHQKELYLKGEINILPWEEYLPENLQQHSKKKILYDETEQRTGKEKPELKYVQNQEQNTNSIWKRIYNRE